MKSRNFFFLWFIALTILLTTPMAMADTTVNGSGDPTVDVPTVQAAVDLGGVVTLIGTFDFGDFFCGHLVWI